MQLYNYLKLFGAFTNAYQLIPISPEPTDRQEKRMLEEAQKLIDASWSRRAAALLRKEGEAGEAVDLDAEKAAFYPATVDGKLLIPLQYLQDYMVRKMAAIQNNTSIHNPKECAELKQIFGDYGVTVMPALKGLVLDRVGWSAKELQKPKILVHAKAGEEEVCIRFEAAGELGLKFLHALLALGLRPGMAFDVEVEAVDPAIAKNARAGKKVADTGLYVNHNLRLTVAGKVHTGHPPQGQKFCQKPTIEQMETLFRQAQMATETKQAA